MMTASRAPASPRPRTLLTAAAVATSYFERELQFYHDNPSTALRADTVVILHDACYGHRYSRPKTSKATLNTIVERPERLQAAARGVATAYVRLGGRHSDGPFPPEPIHESHLPPDIPFRVRKSSRMVPLSSPTVTSVHGAGWMKELESMCDAAETKLSQNGKELGRPASSDGIAEKPKLHEGDLYLCGQSLEALEGTLGAVCDGVDAVFQEAEAAAASTARKAFVCVRPPGHHCSADYPSGFCWLNNVHVGISYAASTYGLTHAAIIDFDLHHGDGSQEITWAHNAERSSLPKKAPASKRCSIGYFSLHDINSYPCEMGDEEKVRNASVCVENAHDQTVWNVHLQPWRNEAEFWELYETKYSILLEKARQYLKTQTRRILDIPNHPKPKAAIFVSAGFDASEWEGAGMQRHKVNVPTDFYARFTSDIVDLADEHGLAVDGRVVSVLEGGYSDRALSSGVLGHLAGLAAAKRKAETGVPLENGLRYEMGQRLGSVREGDQQASGAHSRLSPSISNWWSIPQLEELEALVHGPPPAPPARKARVATPPTYSSATQSSMAKVVSSPKPYRSVSGPGPNGLVIGASASSSRPPSPPPPPPPAVDWATAAHELSKLLVPSNRPTGSCRPEELSVSAERDRKARHSTIGLPAPPETMAMPKMTLRDRRGKPPSYVFDDGDEDVKPAVSRAHRRRTVAGPGLTKDKAAIRGAVAVAAAAELARPAISARRRSSAGSSMTAVSGGEPAEVVPPMPAIVPAVPPPVNAAVTAMARQRKKARPSTTGKSTAPTGDGRTGAARSRTTKPNIPAIPPTHDAAPDQAHDGDGAAPAVQAVEAARMAAHQLSSEIGDEGADMERLTEGLVRIKLNVPSRDVYEARRGHAA